jgi:hypothetical protein
MTHAAREFLPVHTVALFADRVASGEPASAWPEDNGLGRGAASLTALPIALLVLSG